MLVGVKGHQREILILKNMLKLREQLMVVLKDNHTTYVLFPDHNPHLERFRWPKANILHEIAFEYEVMNST